MVATVSMGEFQLAMAWELGDEYKSDMDRTLVVMAALAEQRIQLGQGSSYPDALAQLTAQIPSLVLVDGLSTTAAHALGTVLVPRADENWQVFDARQFAGRAFVLHGDPFRRTLRCVTVLGTTTVGDVSGYIPLTTAESNDGSTLAYSENVTAVWELVPDARSHNHVYIADAGLLVDTTESVLATFVPLYPTTTDFTLSLLGLHSDAFSVASATEVRVTLLAGATVTMPVGGSASYEHLSTALCPLSCCAVVDAQGAAVTSYTAGASGNTLRFVVTGRTAVMDVLA